MGTTTNERFIVVLSSSLRLFGGGFMPFVLFVYFVRQPWAMIACQRCGWPILDRRLGSTGRSAQLGIILSPTGGRDASSSSAVETICCRNTQVRKRSPLLTVSAIQGSVLLHSYNIFCRGVLLLLLFDRLFVGWFVFQ